MSNEPFNPKPNSSISAAPAKPAAGPLEDPSLKQLLQKSATLRTDVDKAQKAGFSVSWGAANGGTFIDEKKKRVVVDANEKGDGSAIAQSLAHEFGHHKFKEKQDQSSKESYVRGLLRDEAAATINNAQVRKEILDNGGPDIGFPGIHAIQYRSITDQMLAGKITEKDALQKISEVFKTEKTSTTGQTYEDYYGASYPGSKKSPAPDHSLNARSVMPQPTRSEEVPAPVPSAQPQASAPIIPEHLRDFRHEGHPLHHRYSEVLNEVHAAEDRNKVAHGPHSEQLAAALTEKIAAARYDDPQFPTFGDVGRIDLRATAQQTEAVVTQYRPSYHMAERAMALGVDEGLSRSVEQVSADWTRQHRPHLHDPQPTTAKSAPELNPLALPAHDLRHPDHPRHAMFAQVRGQLSNEYDRWGLLRDPAQLDRETAQCVVQARDQRMGEVGGIQLSFPSGMERPTVTLQENPANEFGNRTSLDAAKLTQAPEVDQASVQLQQVEQHLALAMRQEQQFRQEREVGQSQGRSM